MPDENIADLRREYTRAGLNESDTLSDPIDQFHRWFQEALKGGVAEPNAMTLATAAADGQPSARVLLLKGADERGFSFFTNYESRKGHELAANPRASMVFFWPELERQIRIHGTVTQLPRSESEAYFRSRPEGNRLGAWVSMQSQVIPNRNVLEEKLKEVTERFQGREIPIPPYWGGFILEPQSIEFWQGRLNRLHDRLIFRKQTCGGWIRERLAP